jgi:hypothetical protein
MVRGRVDQAAQAVVRGQDRAKGMESLGQTGWALDRQAVELEADLATLGLAQWVAGFGVAQVVELRV